MIFPWLLYGDSIGSQAGEPLACSTGTFVLGRNGSSPCSLLAVRSAISLAITFQWTLPCNRILAQQVPSQLGKLLERRQGRHSHFLIPSVFFCYCLWFNDAIERTFCYSLKLSAKLDFKRFSFCPNYPFCLLLLYVPLAGHWPFSQISCNWFIWHRDKMTHTALISNPQSSSAYCKTRASALSLLRLCVHVSAL